MAHQMRPLDPFLVEDTDDVLGDGADPVRTSGRSLRPAPR
jgi:hypothetical protein